MHVSHIVSQHAEEAAVIRQIRSRLVRAPHVRLRDLARFDQRLVAHLDGLEVADEESWVYCDRALAEPGTGPTFVAGVRAIGNNHAQRLEPLLALALADRSAERGLTSAFGWVSAASLRGIVSGLLKSGSSERRLGLAACTMHRVDPGLSSPHYVEDVDASVRSRALRAIGELGRTELTQTCLAALADEDVACRFWAAWSAALISRSNRALATLEEIRSSGEFGMAALALILISLGAAEGHAVLRNFASGEGPPRLLIWGAGIVGDPAYVSWLLRCMEDPALSRSAGEAFTTLTGVDLIAKHLHRHEPVPVPGAPNDDADDPNVSFDEDEDLPWPEPARVGAWWHSNSHRFQPGVRYFMGEPLNRENCVRVLKDGFQRQRILAAHYLCLLEPGTVLFNTSAPAWRQQRLLSQMS